MARRAIALHLTVALLLTGCATAPRTRDVAPSTLPKQFSSDGGRTLPARWWRYFDDPALNRVVDRALAGNFSLAAAADRLRQARAVARREGASQLPAVNGEGHANRQHQNGTTTHEYALGAAASYELDLWGRVAAGARAADFEAQATAQDLGTAAISLSAETATAYYQREAIIARLALLSRQMDTNRRIAQVIETRVRYGQSSVEDLLRQRQLVEQTRSTLYQTQADLKTTEHQLAVLLGHPPASGIKVPRSQLQAIPALPATGVPAKWLRRRPDLRAAFLRVREADENIASAIADRYPRFNLSATLQSLSESPANLFQDWISTLAASFSVPLFDGGQRSAEVERTRSARAEALHRYGQTVAEAAQEVEDALSTADRDAARYQSLQRQVTLANQSLDLLRTRYLNGEGNYLDVLSELSSLQDTERNRLNAYWTLVQDRIALARALAGDWGFRDNMNTPQAGSPPAPSSPTSSSDS